MSEILPIPTADKEALRQQALGSHPTGTDLRQSEVQREVQAAALTSRPRLPKATFADSLGRPPKPDLYQPTRWQKVRDKICPCLAPPKVNRIESARAERPRSRFFGNFDVFAAAPEPPASASV